MNFWGIICCLIISPLLVEGLQGIIQGAPCIKCKDVTGCEGKYDYGSLLFLYEEKDRNEAECLHKCGYRLSNSTSFKQCNRTVIIIHGFIEGVCREAWMREMRCQLQARHKNWNVILSDYTNCNTPDLQSASFDCVPRTAAEIAKAILNIMNKTGCGADTFYLIGMSLGAHVAGFVGKIIYKETGQKLGRITGMDAAAGPFLGQPCEKRLCYTDAMFVDIIHTNGGECVIIYFGIYDPLGHVDFYVNGGKYQYPACFKYAIDSIKKGDLFYGFATLLLPPFCSHGFAQVLFRMSINPCNCQFIGVKYEDYEIYKKQKMHNCEKGNCLIMGLDADKHWNGDNTTNNKYYVETTDDCPYCSYSNLNLTNYPVEKGPCFRP